MQIEAGKSQIKITDKNFEETRSKLKKQSIEILRSIARRFNMKEYEQKERSDLIDEIVQKIKDVMVKKYQPEDHDKLKQITDLLVKNLINTPANRKKKPKEKRKDPARKLEIQNMAGKFKKNRQGEIIKRKCKTCQKEFDNHIVRWTDLDSSLFECPHCIILSNDPLNQVIEILYEPSILKNNKTYNYKLSYINFNKINNDQRIGVEIRTLKLDGEHFYEQTWPDKCVIRVNGNIIKKIDPLNQNSSLKKRRDQKFFSRSMCKVGTNALNVCFKNIRDGKNTKCNFDPNYVFTIVLVKKRTVEELGEDILSRCQMTEEESKFFITKKFSKENAQNDLLISEIKADLLCKISFTYVKNPTRGEFCTHLDCFSLDYFLRSMEQNLVRRWICPLCRKRCLNLKVDKYFEKVIDEAKAKGNFDITKVFFKSDGRYALQVDEFEDDNEEIEEGDGMREKGDNLEILSITTDDNERKKDFGQNGNEVEKPKVFLYGKNTLLKKRKRPFEATEAIETKRIKMDKNYRKDESFLFNLWRHHETQKHQFNKNLVYKTLEEFRQKFLELCEKDIFFSKKITLLYKFVLNRRRENQNSIVMRYNKILDEVKGQPNWIYGIEPESYKMLKIGNLQEKDVEKSTNSEKEKEDTMLLRSLLDDYNLEFDEDMSDTVEGLKNNGSSKMPIEII